MKHVEEEATMKKVEKLSEKFEMTGIGEKNGKENTQTKKKRKVEGTEENKNWY